MSGAALVTRGGGARTGPRDGPATADRGSASILVLALGLVLVMAGVAGAMVASARLARHTARTAADLAALAAAGRAVEGPEVACAAARRYAAANGARMTSCEVTGWEVVVRTEVPVRWVRAGATAAARAGPVTSGR
ncbi:secretion/DNA translocation related TadE-like protein [Actinoplanes octamycinicus]|uniref:Secretion/DNA translocation related TadE-like protein n=1 Tax=Actinoplanes octamycinicus TaxID=135948 RepID=A0A7W7M693_9ACTN|nr:Rv3654c family TadE-like protein [Actinoplanes octamycinicus]MBB4738495.1 secretion/DNA translocation related TadE-like protein [Actinoplanes octamycinicus]GIE57616.1 hypothetical protein Aoc01nite_30180 [Actinoplanes octamycinicus]